MGIATLAATEAYLEPAIEAALSVEEEKGRIKALGRVVGKWAEREPGAAAAWLDENGYRDEATQWEVAQRFARLDPEGSADWLLHRTSPEKREKALSMALVGWSRVDVKAASAWLEKAGPTDGSIRIIAEAYTAHDLGKAVEWAKRASDGMRDEVIAGTLAYARQFNLSLDLTPYLEAGSLSAEEMKKKVGEMQRRVSRF